MSIAAIGAGCDPKDEPTQPSASQAPAPDAVDPSGLIEGPNVAFGLRLPFRSVVLEESPTGAQIDLPFPLEQVSTYVRARVETSDVKVGPGSTRFQSAAVIGGAPEMRFDIVLKRMSGATKISMIRRFAEEPPPVEPAPTVSVDPSLFEKGPPPKSE